MRQDSGKKIQPTQQGGRMTLDDVWVSRSLEGYSQDAGSENWEPGRRRLVKRAYGKPERLVQNVSRRTRARRRVARAEAWLDTWRHVDSRTSTVSRLRGVFTTVERGGRKGDGAGLPRRDLCHPTADLTIAWQYKWLEYLQTWLFSFARPYKKSVRK